MIPNSIFLSQATYPIKGLHQVIQAVALLKKEFPDLTIRVAGQNITDTDGFWKKLKISGYGSYIRKLLKKYDLQKQINFTGILSEDEMVREYQNAHLFISPSSIENSSNSVGEAQLIGTPTIASYVGGIPDLIIHGKTGLLYQFEEVEMLAENIRIILTNNKLANHLSRNGIEAAAKRHNRQANLSQTIDIYKEVLAGRTS
jgi:glycosyltransferase involved in cell wall biosynthesis